MSDADDTDSASKDFHTLSVTVDAGLASRILAILAESAFPASVWERDSQNQADVMLYLESQDTCDSAIPVLQNALETVGMAGSMICRGTLRREHWAEWWKRYFHASRVSDRIVICPPWETWQTQANDLVIRIDPGMSFGTGQHDTTRDCLVFLDQLASAGVHGAMHDLGCGSGILSIAASKLGFIPVRGMDHDPIAVSTAHEQARLNGLNCREVRFDCLDIEAAPSIGEASVVAANILAPVLLAHANAISACVSPGGWLLLAGILREQYADVLHDYQLRGFRESAFREHSEWSSGCLQKMATSSV